MLLRILLCLALTPLSASPQGEQELVPEASVELTPLERSYVTLAALQKSRDDKREALAQKRAELADVVDEDQRAALLLEGRRIQVELDEINANYESIATGIDVQAFRAIPAQAFDLQGELQELVRPIVEELKGATEAPRQIESLRSQLDHYDERVQLASNALANIEGLLESIRDRDPMDLAPGLEESRASWAKQLEEIEGRKTFAQYQLDKRLSQRTSILDSTRSALSQFFRTRGLNLLLAVLVFFAVLIGMRALYRLTAKFIRRTPREERPFYSRLVDVLYFMFVGSTAVVASLLVLYARGDWVLLGVTLLFLIGVAWAGKTAVPMFLEQIRLLLNLGTVRERERVVIDGIPYRVSKLTINTLVANAELAGGVRRIPIRDLIDMRSRTCSKDEIWFPCKRGDWVLLSDGKRGEVKHQSPDSVQIQLLGGSRVTYPTTDFLGLAPQNLSHGFRLTVSFGVDYAHQAICTTEVPKEFLAHIGPGLAARFGADAIRALKVEFLEAGASSLDYAVILDVDGSAARHYEALKREVQLLCVETCNARGWVIPFTQITMHQAEPSS